MTRSPTPTYNVHKQEINHGCVKSLGFQLSFLANLTYKQMKQNRQGNEGKGHKGREIKTGQD